MAVDDIRVKLTFKSSRKRFRLRKLAGSDAIVALLDLWIETASQFPLGTLYDCTPDDIEHMAGWTGSPGLFVSAAVDAGFLIRKTETEWELHDWQDHQRWVVHAPARTEAGRIAAHKRWESVHGADVMRSACGAHAEGNAPIPSPIPIPPPSPLNPIASTPGTVAAPRPPRKPIAIPEQAEEWNRLAAKSGLQAVQAWNSSRSRALSARMKDGWFRDNWQAIFAEAHRNDWCREHHVGIDHVLRPDNAVRYYESSKGKAQRKADAPKPPIRILVNFTDKRPTEEYTCRDEQELAETVAAMGLEPVLFDGGEHWIHDGYREYRLDVEAWEASRTGPDRRLTKEEK